MPRGIYDRSKARPRKARRGRRSSPADTAAQTVETPEAGPGPELARARITNERAGRGGRRARGRHGNHDQENRSSGSQSPWPSDRASQIINTLLVLKQTEAVLLTELADAVRDR